MMIKNSCVSLLTLICLSMYGASEERENIPTYGFIRCLERSDYAQQVKKEDRDKKQKDLDERGTQKKCVFCKVIQDDPQNDEENLIVKRFITCTAMMNLYPYTTGSMLIVPNNHKGELTDFSDSEVSELMVATKKISKVLKNELNPDGFNFLINEGRAAGASKPDHLHMQAVLRNIGDTSGLTVASGTIVVSDDPKKVCSRLRKQLPLEETHKGFSLTLGHE